MLQVAVITVAFPVTPLLLARARICISASHTREDLMKALDVSVFLCINTSLYSKYSQTDVFLFCATHFQVISRVDDLVGIKYFPAEPPKIAEADAEITSCP